MVELSERYRRDRDPRAYEALVRAYSPLVYSVCRRYLREPADVEDAAQETFLKFAAHVDTIRGSAPAWLAATAYTTANLLIRRAIRERRRRLAASRQPPAANPLLHGAVHGLLHRALAAMGEPPRRLIVERFFRRTPLRLLAEAGQESVATASRRVSAALAELAAILRDMGLDSIDERTLAGHFGALGAIGEPSAGLDPLRFAADWRTPELATAAAGESSGATAPAVPGPTLPGWSRPLRIGVIVSHATSVTPALTPTVAGTPYLPIEEQAMTAQLIRNPAIALVGIVEPGTTQLGPVERTLREYELTGGLIEGTDAEGLATLDVILFGINWQLAAGVAAAVSRAVQGGVGLLNEWWVHSQGGRGDEAVCQLMLAEPPMFAYHTPVPCGTETPATVVEEHHLLPGLTRGAAMMVSACGPVYRPTPGTRVLIAKDHVVPEAEHGIEALGPARMPVCLVGHLGRGRVFVTNTFRQARFAAVVSVPAEDYLMRVLAWLAEPRRVAGP